jgi:hypothetical protein
MTTPSDPNLKRVLDLAREMIALADEGDRDRVDDSCGILYGILRDSGYRLRVLVAEEGQRHERQEARSK